MLSNINRTTVHHRELIPALDQMLGKLKELSPENHSVLLAKGIIQQDIRQE